MLRFNEANWKRCQINYLQICSFNRILPLPYASFIILTVIINQLMSEDLVNKVNALTEQVAQHQQTITSLQGQLENQKTLKKQAEDMYAYTEKEKQDKQAQIIRLKQQDILVKKMIKTQKAEIAQLTAENAALKEQVAASQTTSEEVAASKALEEELAALKQTVSRLTQQLSKAQSQSQSFQQKWKVQQVQWQNKQKSLGLQNQRLSSIAEQLKNYNEILEGKLLAKEKAEGKSKSLEKKNNIAQTKPAKDREASEERTKDMQAFINQLQQKIRQYEKKLNENKETIRIQNDEIQSLQSRLKALSLKNQPQFSSPSNLNKSINLLNQTQYSHPSPFMKSSIIEDEDFSNSRIHYSCLLVTKPHYMSPFLQVYQDKKLLKIYKSTRSGCFQRSMGYYKHKFDNLSFEQEQIIDPIAQAILDSSDITHHSIILYGVKKSNKKYIMSKILVRLKNFLISKLSDCEEMSSIYLKRSQEEKKNATDKGSTRQEIIDIINKVISLGYKNEKTKEVKLGASPRKVQSKPKVRFFNFTADNFYFEIGTSSFTNLSFRQKMTPANMLNNILYSKLPDIMQSAITQKYLVLTVNPIVDLYDDCRNTLSTTFCRASQARQEEEREEKSSPVREELNEIVRRKLEGLERENEQVLIRSRKFQEECNYYRTRFDELQCRLKNLLNTHSGQTSYLKKSPVTLSYQKLLKFVHSVQSRTQMASFLQLNQSILGKTSTIYIQKQSHSVDAL